MQVLLSKTWLANHFRAVLRKAQSVSVSFLPLYVSSMGAQDKKFVMEQATDVDRLECVSGNDATLRSCYN